MIDYLLDELNQLGTLENARMDARISCVEELQARAEVLEEEQEDAPDWAREELENIVNNYIIAKSGNDPATMTNASTGNPVGEGWDPNQIFTWGEWRLEEATDIVDDEGNPIGYSDFILRTLRPALGGAPYHKYSQPPPSVSWDLDEVEQRGIRFFIGSAKVDEIDAVCSVPALPIEMNADETGRRVLDRTLGETEWQRQVDPKRVLSITNFIKEEGNIIANSAILYAPPQALGVEIEGSQITINFEDFLIERMESFHDHDFTDGLPGDQRPVWLIDGQHRTRGLAQSIIGKDLKIPIIVFVDPFSLSQAAKVFAEINTLQAKLDPLHTLFMQHRFQIPAPTAKRDFRPWTIDNQTTWNSRMNTLSYEAAGWLAQNMGGPLNNRIQILKSNSPRIAIIKANAWLDYSRDWFSENGPYSVSIHDELSTEQIFQEIENYFQAMVNTCNHRDWPDGFPRWSPNSVNKGVLQYHSSSQALLKLFPHAHLKANIPDIERPISIARFEEILKPLKWADWRHDQVINRYKGSGEPPRTSLREWMITAVQHGIQYTSDLVMSSEIPSEPGQGLLSPPISSPINIEGGQLYPDPAIPQGVILTSNRPVHALSKAHWSVQDHLETNRLTKAIGSNQGTNLSTLTLKYESWMDNTPFIRVRVEWNNINPPAAHSVLELTNPNYGN